MTHHLYTFIYNLGIVRSGSPWGARKSYMLWCEHMIILTIISKVFFPVFRILGYYKNILKINKFYWLIAQCKYYHVMRILYIYIPHLHLLEAHPLLWALLKTCILNSYAWWSPRLGQIQTKLQFHPDSFIKLKESLKLMPWIPSTYKCFINFLSFCFCHPFINSLS